MSGQSRRQFLRGAAASGLVLSSATGRAATRKSERDEAKVTPGEDLMQEHGVLERVLLIYGEAARRIDQQQAFDLTTIGSAAGIVRHFVEDYHEHTEENFVFPRLEKAGKLVELVAVLRVQHKRGRELTDTIQKLTLRPASTPELAAAMRAFERMYRPHAAREDTVLFPAFRELLSDPAYRELGEKFEALEQEKLGKGGFESAVAEVSRLESVLGIGDLSKFTPG
jgi:hemerythrin-like domain-containing protein